MKSVLFVCHGNICRSPMAEYIFKYLTDNKVKCSSRATSYEEIGNDIHHKTKMVLDKHNIPYNRHHASRITYEDYLEYDLIVCFDEYNLSNIESIIGNKDKVIKILDHDVDDPWYTNDFDLCFNEIYNGCLLLKNIVGYSN